MRRPSSSNSGATCQNSPAMLYSPIRFTSCTVMPAVAPRRAPGPARGCRSRGEHGFAGDAVAEVLGAVEAGAIDRHHRHAPALGGRLGRRLRGRRRSAPERRWSRRTPPPAVVVDGLLDRVQQALLAAAHDHVLLGEVGGHADAVQRRAADERVPRLSQLEARRRRSARARCGRRRRSAAGRSARRRRSSRRPWRPAWSWRSRTSPSCCGRRRARSAVRRFRRLSSPSRRRRAETGARASLSGMDLAC
jgi:hypothetical protein